MYVWIYMTVRVCRTSVVCCWWIRPRNPIAKILGATTELGLDANHSHISYYHGVWRCMCYRWSSVQIVNLNFTLTKILHSHLLEHRHWALPPNASEQAPLIFPSSSSGGAGERLCMRIELRDIKTSDIVQKDAAIIHSDMLNLKK